MNITNFLKDKNLKVTKGREVILDIIFESSESLSAEEIFNECKRKGQNINLSTVYRTIDIFLDNNIIDKFILENGISTYKLHKRNHNHKLECDLCHKEIELECPIKQIEEIILKETGFKVTNHSLKISGICKKCEKETQK